MKLKDLPAGHNCMYLTAAHGRQYELAESVRADWEDGKDFKIYQGPYCSIRDSNRMLQSGFTHVMVVWQTKSLLVEHEAFEIKPYKVQ